MPFMVYRTQELEDMEPETEEATHQEEEPPAEGVEEEEEEGIVNQSPAAAEPRRCRFNLTIIGEESLAQSSPATTPHRWIVVLQIHSFIEPHTFFDRIREPV